jgi:hypothetical protein
MTAIKDDVGIGVTRPIIEKLSQQDLYPLAAQGNGTTAEGRWGVGVNGSSPTDLDGAEKTPIGKSKN